MLLLHIKVNILFCFDLYSLRERELPEMETLPECILIVKSNSTCCNFSFYPLLSTNDLFSFPFRPFKEILPKI